MMDPETEKLLHEILAQDCRLPGVDEGKPRGWDVEVMARQVLAQMMLDREWSQNQAAQKLGLQQRSVGRFLHGQGQRLETLSKIVNAIESTPARYFAEHPELKGTKTRPHMRVAREQDYDRLLELLGGARLAELLRALATCARVGTLDAATKSVRQYAEAGKSARRKAFSEASRRDPST
jgi:transcriptional regulator with XRE-family HTH domain